MIDRSQLKVGLVGPLPPPSGGMANQMNQLKGLLEQEGVEVAVAQVNAPYKPMWVGKIKGIRALARMIPYLMILWKVTGKVDVLHVLANSGWSWHLFAAPAIRIARRRGTPVVINYRGGEAEVFFKKSFRQVKKTLKFASGVIVPSAYLQTVFDKWNWPTEVVPNIINLGRFSVSSKEKFIGPPRILVARNLEPIYDNSTAIRAFSLLLKDYPHAQLVVAGSGPERENLLQLVNSENLSNSVTFTGRVDNAQMAELFGQSTIMLNPSLADNMPNSVLESLASGVPVVSTNVGGIPYLVRHEETALLVEPGDYVGMAREMQRLIENKALRENLISNGAFLVRQFTWESVREKLFHTYERVIVK